MNETEIDDLNATIDSLQSEIADLRDRLAESREAAAVAVDNCVALRQRAELAEQDAADRRGERDNLATMVEALQAERDVWRERSGTQSRAANHLYAQIAELRSELSAALAEVAETNRHLSEVMAETEQLRAVIANGAEQLLTERAQADSNAHKLARIAGYVDDMGGGVLARQIRFVLNS